LGNVQKKRKTPKRGGKNSGKKKGGEKPKSFIKIGKDGGDRKKELPKLGLLPLSQRKTVYGAPVTVSKEKKVIIRNKQPNTE